MPSSERRESRDGILYATADLLLAAGVTAAVLAVGLAAANAALGEPVAGRWIRTAVLLTASAATYPFVTGLWSLDRFLDFAWTALGALLALATLAALPLLAVGGIPTESTLARTLEFAVVAGAYAVAAVHVSVRTLF